MAVCGTEGEDAVAAAVKVARLAHAMIERTRVLVSADGQKIQIRIGAQWLGYPWSGYSWAAESKIPYLLQY